VLVFGELLCEFGWPYNLRDVIQEGNDPRDVGDSDHQFAKGVDGFSWLIEELTPEGGLVVDPFAGRSTTGVAAIIGGRRYIGIEKNKVHVAKSWDRLRHAIEAREEYEAGLNAKRRSLKKGAV
jgi:DNA modification methylase